MLINVFIEHLFQSAGIYFIKNKFNSSNSKKQF